MTEANVRIETSLVIPAALAHEARVLANRRGGDSSLRGAMLEGLRLWIARERNQAGPPGGGAAGATVGPRAEVYLIASVTSGWLDELAALLKGRGAGFGLADAVIEGLRLWIVCERERPRPELDEQRIKESLRLTCCCLLVHL